MLRKIFNPITCHTPDFQAFLFSEQVITILVSPYFYDKSTSTVSLMLKDEEEDCIIVNSFLEKIIEVCN